MNVVRKFHTKYQYKVLTYWSYPFSIYFFSVLLNVEQVNAMYGAMFVNFEMYPREYVTIADFVAALELVEEALNAVLICYSLHCWTCDSNSKSWLTHGILGRKRNLYFLGSVPTTLPVFLSVTRLYLWTVMTWQLKFGQMMYLKTKYSVPLVQI